MDHHQVLMEANKLETLCGDQSDLNSGQVISDTHTMFKFVLVAFPLPFLLFWKWSPGPHTSRQAADHHPQS